MKKTYTREIFEEMDEKYGDQVYKMFGPTLLGFPEDVNSSRLYMFTSNIKQVLTLLDPEVPRLQTGYENTIGRYNNAYRKLEGQWEVKDKILKYSDGSLYLIVLYNSETDTYEMLEKQVAESLTERFGYLYQTEEMDALEIGSVVMDPILWKSTSYDKNMNYRFGRNARVFNSTSNDTLEDALVIRRGWADNMKSVEVDTIRVPINTNDVLLNLYGDEEHYKTFPDLGEFVRDATLCATRRLKKEHLLFDFQSKNMQEIYSTDTDYFVSPNSTVYDINVFYNGDDPFPDKVFYHQLNRYYEEQRTYAEAVTEAARKIKSSGSKYTDNVPFYKSKYQMFVNPEYKWKEKDRAFGNLLVEFKVQSVVSLELGSKLTGRYGDKGVVSHIVETPEAKAARDQALDSFLDLLGKPVNEEERAALAKNIVVVDDDKMPYTDNFPVDIICNAAGPIRRTNPGQLVEVDLNFAGERIREHITTLTDWKEKERIIFRFLELVNQDECDFFWDRYRSCDTLVKYPNPRTNGTILVRFVNQNERLKFIEDVEEHGFYLVKPPDANIRYTTLRNIYTEFPFIKPYPMYIDIFGTKKRRIAKDGIIGEKYILVLKHNSNKNFSARSTFHVNRSNLPAKDPSKRNNRSPYAKSPIKIGEMYNLMSGMTGRQYAEFSLFTRNSVLGRKSLQRILESDGNPLDLKRIKVKPEFTNANVDNLIARMKAIGIRLHFHSDLEQERVVWDDLEIPMSFGPYVIHDSPLKKDMYSHLFREFRAFLRDQIIIESYPGEREELAWNHVWSLPEIKEYEIPGETKDLLITITQKENPWMPLLPDPITEGEEDDEDSIG